MTVRAILVCIGVLSLAGRCDGDVLRSRRQADDLLSATSCSIASERSEMIIQTKQSLAAGAVFLVAPNVDSQDDCLSECCNTASCNTAVVKWKARQFVRAILSGVVFLHILCFWPSNLQGLGWG